MMNCSYDSNGLSSNLGKIVAACSYFECCLRFVSSLLLTFALLVLLPRPQFMAPPSHAPTTRTPRP